MNRKHLEVFDHLDKGYKSSVETPTGIGKDDLEFEFNLTPWESKVQ